MFIEALSTARDLGRVRDIAGVLIRYGLGDMVRRFGLADMLDRAGQTLRWEHSPDLGRQPPPVLVRQALEELGPTFVKLGQILAGRADLFDPEWITEFERLHSRVPALPLSELMPTLSDALEGDPATVFAWFDEVPLAAASIAQVHRATLHDGAQVIVKIRRPGIREVIEADLRLLDRFAGIAESDMPAMKMYRPREIVREFSRSLRLELDLAAECRHAERIANNMVALDFVHIPKVYWDYTSETVNVQEFIDGVPGNDLVAIDRLALNRQLLARRGAQAMLKMIVQDGFFHADPHPGNLFYLPGDRMAFIDFGMVGRLSSRRRDELLRLLLGLVQREPEDVVDVLLDWAGDDHSVNLSALENEIEAFVDQYHGTPLADLSLGGMLSDVTSIMREHDLALPSDLALLVKTFISLEGMGRTLDPEFHMATEALPLLRAVMRAKYRPKALAGRAVNAAQRLLEVGEQLPQDLSRLMRNVRRGKVQVGIDIHHIRHVGDELNRSANRLSVSLVIAALIIGSSIVLTVDAGPKLFGLPAFGLVGFVGAAIGGVWLVRSIWKSGRTRDE